MSVALSREHQGLRQPLHQPDRRGHSGPPPERPWCSADLSWCRLRPLAVVVDPLLGHRKRVGVRRYFRVEQHVDWRGHDLRMQRPAVVNGHDRPRSPPLSVRFRRPDVYEVAAIQPRSCRHPSRLVSRTLQRTPIRAAVRPSCPKNGLTLSRPVRESPGPKDSTTPVVPAEELPEDPHAFRACRRIGRSARCARAQRLELAPPEHGRLRQVQAPTGRHLASCLIDRLCPVHAIPAQRERFLNQRGGPPVWVLDDQNVVRHRRRIG